MREKEANPYNVPVKAKSPGMCWICGGRIFVGESIRLTKTAGNPTACHEHHFHEPADGCAQKEGSD